MRTIFEAVRLIDGVADVAREDVDVVVDGERISAVVAHGAPLPADPADDGAPAVVIDGRGRTLLPGLIDAHAHYTFDPTEGSIATIARRSDAEILRAAAGHAAVALRAGVTTARGAGSIRNLEVVLRDAIAAGQRVRVRGWSSPGPRSGSPAGMATRSGSKRTAPTALVTATRRVVRDGADVVKVVASEAAMLTTTGLEPGRMVHGAPELTEAELRAIVETAAELGVKVMSHAQDGESVRRSAVAGVDSVEHAWLADRARSRRSPGRAPSLCRPWS